MLHHIIPYFCLMILVTGGTGFLGAHLLFHLSHREEKIRAVKRHSSSLETAKKIFSFYAEEIGPFWNKIEWVDADVLDIVSLEEVMEGVDTLYHTAAVVSYDPSEREMMMETNIQGTANVMDTARIAGIKKVCHVSSIAALGRAGNNGITDEETPWTDKKDISAYSLSKFEAEREVWRAMAEGLNAVIVNPSVILGPGDWNKGTCKLFKMVHDGLKVYTTGVNGYVDVNDVAKAMILLTESEISGERFVLNSENISYKELFTMMAEALHVSPPQIRAGKFLTQVAWRVLKWKSLFTGKPPFITRDLARTAGNRYFYSSEKIKHATGFRFAPVKETIRYTAELFLRSLE